MIYDAGMFGLIGEDDDEVGFFIGFYPFLFLPVVTDLKSWEPLFIVSYF